MESVPQGWPDRLAPSPLATVYVSRRVAVALAIRLFSSRDVSIGPPLSSRGTGRVEFHHLPVRLDCAVC